MQIQAVTFSEAKAGNTPQEDGASGGVVGETAGAARFIVLDGASGAYDPVRWVDQLVSSFERPDGPSPEPVAIGTWFGQMQDQWATGGHVFDSIVEERKFHQVGSFATLLAFEITGLDGPEALWRAVALGDTVLFHVRENRAIATFPPLGPGDFASRPDGVHTLRPSLARMNARLKTGAGALVAGDFLFAATDALAHWILRAIARDGGKVWATLASLAHPDVFARFVEDQRREADGDFRMKNDDVTLMRLRMLADQPAFLLACR